MRIVLSTGSGDVDLEVVVHDPTATVADLVAALPGIGPAAWPLVVDGVPQPGTAGLAGCGLRPGCSIGLVPGQERPRVARGVCVGDALVSVVG
ncbi:MAG: hypothetical protein WKF86_07815, partial [Acidimicrobiales bacterium]